MSRRLVLSLSPAQWQEPPPGEVPLYLPNGPELKIEPLDVLKVEDNTKNARFLAANRDRISPWRWPQNHIGTMRIEFDE